MFTLLDKDTYNYSERINKVTAKEAAPFNYGVTETNTCVLGTHPRSVKACNSHDIVVTCILVFIGHAQNSGNFLLLFSVLVGIVTDVVN